MLLQDQISWLQNKNMRFLDQIIVQLVSIQQLNFSLPEGDLVLMTNQLNVDGITTGWSGFFTLAPPPNLGVKF